MLVEGTETTQRFFENSMGAPNNYLGSNTPPRIPVANEGLVWDSLLKMVHNPGGGWHPGWGVDLITTHLGLGHTSEIPSSESLIKQERHTVEVFLSCAMPLMEK